VRHQSTKVQHYKDKKKGKKDKEVVWKNKERAKVTAQCMETELHLRKVLGCDSGQVEGRYGGEKPDRRQQQQAKRLHDRHH